eukprot:12527632-Ditylum_brightwellii.AAC.1
MDRHISLRLTQQSPIIIPDAIDIKRYKNTSPATLFFFFGVGFEDDGEGVGTSVGGDDGNEVRLVTSAVAGSTFKSFIRSLLMILTTSIWVSLIIFDPFTNHDNKVSRRKT